MLKIGITIGDPAGVGPEIIVRLMDHLDPQYAYIIYGEEKVLKACAKEPLEEKEIMWVETIDKLLEDEGLRKNYSEKAKQRAEDFSIEKILIKWRNILSMSTF